VSGPVPAAVLEAFGAAGAAVRPLGAGLINHTYLVEGTDGRFVLQRLHAIFAPEVNEDIEAVTRHLQARGQLTPLLVRTRAGALWQAYDGATWRALTWVDGVALGRIGNAAQAREAGAVLARFHLALSDLRHEFRHARHGVHDTARHLGNLRSALARHAAHPRFRAIEPLAHRILAAAGTLPPLPDTPLRAVHGDPKASNVLFAEDRRRALCMVDLDTLARMRLPLELGDAFRSWCNPAGEDEVHATFSLELFEGSIAGYATEAHDLPDAAEREALVTATETICLELAARFCADALEERYFGWDERRFATRGEHNEVRAASQLAAAASLAEQRTAAQAVVRRAFR